MNIRRLITSVLFVFILFGCRSSAPSKQISIRLTELYKPQSVERTGKKPAPDLPRTEWRFDQIESLPASEQFPDTAGWEAGPGVKDLVIRNGLLTGKSTTYFPVIHLQRTASADDRDVLHAIEIRMRVSAGTRLSVSYENSDKIDLKKVVDQAKDFPWMMKVSLLPSDKIQTYTLKDPRPPMSVDLRHLMIRPTDIAGVTFEIESIRLIFRKEYLAGIPSGVRWEGLSQIYHETIVSHAAEKISFTTALGDRPWLDVSLGTLENQPLTFRAAVHARDKETQVMQRTITTPSRWEPVQLDLSPYANRTVTLTLSLQAENPDAVGFWGSPVIRDRGIMPRTKPGKIAAPSPQGVILIWVDTLRRRSS